MIKTIDEKLIWLKENDPRFKDYEFKSYHNDLTDLKGYIEKKLKEKRNEELIEEKRIIKLNESNKDTNKTSE
jgi:hypothetical protein